MASAVLQAPLVMPGCGLPHADDLPSDSSLGHDLHEARGVCPTLVLLQAPRDVARPAEIVLCVPQWLREMDQVRARTGEAEAARS